VVKDGTLTASVTGKFKQPVMRLPGLSIDADTHKFVQIRYRLTRGYNAYFIWQRSDRTYAVKSFSVVPDGLFHVYQLDLTDVPAWSGEIISLRFDPAAEIEDVPAGGEIEIDYIRVLDSVVAPPVWEFNTDGDAEGWQMQRLLTDLQINGGALKALVTGRNALMDVADISVDADSFKGVQIKMKVDGGSYARLYWKTKDGTTYSYGFTTIPDSEFHTYNLDLNAISEWSGELTYLGLIPIKNASSGNVEIDFIKVADSLAGPRWEFGEEANPEGWQPMRGLSEFDVSSGTLKTQITDAGPFMVNPLVNFPAEIFPYVQIRYRCASGSTAQLNWIKIKGNRVVNGFRNFSIRSDGLFHVYTIDLSRTANWEDQIVYLRFEPANAAGGELEIDYIRILNRVILPPVFEFDTDGDTQRWKVYRDLTAFDVSAGTLKTQVTDRLPLMLIGYRVPNAYFYLDAGAYKGVQLRMKADSGTHAILCWSGVPGQTHRYAFSIISDNEFHTYNLDLSAIPEWSGDVHFLGLAPKNVRIGDSIEIDSIRFVDTLSGPQWEFGVEGDSEGWIPNASLVVDVSEGNLNAEIVGNNPLMRNPLVGFPAETFPYLKMKFSCTSGTIAELRWTTIDDSGNRGGGITNFTITPGEEHQEYTLDLSEVVDEEGQKTWKGQVTHLRFDPTEANSGLIQIDYIRFSNTPFEE